MNAPDWYYTVQKKQPKFVSMLFKLWAEMDIVCPENKLTNDILNFLVNDYPVGRYLRDAKLWEIGAGTSEVRRLIVGRYFNQLYKK